MNSWFVIARYESTHEETSAYFKVRDIQQYNTPELFTLSRSRNTKGPKMTEWGTPKLHLSIKPVIIKLTKNDNCFRSLGSNERLKTTRGYLKNKPLQPDGSHIDSDPYFWYSLFMPEGAVQTLFLECCECGL